MAPRRANVRGLEDGMQRKTASRDTVTRRTLIDNMDIAPTVGEVVAEYRSEQIAKRMAVEWYRRQLRLLATERGWSYHRCSCHTWVFWIPDLDGRLAAYTRDLVRHDRCSFARAPK